MGGKIDLLRNINLWKNFNEKENDRYMQIHWFAKVIFFKMVLSYNELTYLFIYFFSASRRQGF